MSGKKNGEIEFWRFVFAVIIMLSHSKGLIGGALFGLGPFSVEFFFIVSGYLMMASIVKKGPLSPSDRLGKETFLFLSKKVRNLFPEVIISACIATIFIFVTSALSTVNTALDWLKLCFGDVMLLRMTGMYPGGVNSTLWYVSSMFLAMAILYPLIRKFRDIMCHVVIPVGSVLIIGYLIMQYGTILSPVKWLGWTYKGNLRALAEIGLGVLCYFAAQRLAALSLNTFGKIVISCLKWMCYGGVILCMYLSASGFDALVLIAFSIAIICSFSAQSIGSKLYNNRFFYALGKISMPLFLCHYYFISEFESANLNNIIPETVTQTQKLCIFIICSFATAFVVMLLGDLYKKNRTKIYTAVKRIFIKAIPHN